MHSNSYNGPRLIKQIKEYYNYCILGEIYHKLCNWQSEIFCVS